ncbi:hypothetical protein ASPBRDRAFT_575702 [Aspergillus brasiliensis CBS 101740]|uniref:Uncharacterized protein n=1 Tax=Aspergillus brasiliensis (strain CBS 101740 / IMI 381727 / IBT 21946) TaxID=767769 RepID=A0A1L9UJ52_ASPBC|nr:hypothetical protein ASPBRDRAFT_575702 [Aspergillus brasiliensis CBS 101740]
MGISNADPRFELLWRGHPGFPPKIAKNCERVLVHYCTVHDHPHARIKLRVQLYLGYQNDTCVLVVETDYKIALYSWPPPASITPYFGCPHQDLLSWAFHPSQKNTTCVVCNAMFCRSRTSPAHGEERDVYVIRILGELNWPDIAWQDQCRIRDPISYKRLWASDTGI